MQKTGESKSYIPQLDGRALDFIKIAAAFFMVIDHVNAAFFDNETAWMFLLGRITFPLFCYALAVAFIRHGDGAQFTYGTKKYGLRLFVIALLVEPVSQIARDIPCLNVLFTLSLGAIFIGLSARMKDWQIVLCYIASLAAMVFHPAFEFGLAGMMIPSAMLLALRGKWFAYPFLVMMIYSVNMIGYTSGIAPVMGGTPEEFVTASLIVFSAASVLPWMILSIAQNLPQTGRLVHKYFLHVFYPAHLLLLRGIAYIMGAS